MLSMMETVVVGLLTFISRFLVNGLIYVMSEVLKITVLSPTSPSSPVYQYAMVMYHAVALMSAALLLLGLTWSAFQMQQYRIFSVGPQDTMRQVIGRFVYAGLIIMAGPEMIRILFNLNNFIVSTLTGKNATLLFAPSASVTKAISGTIAAGAIATFASLFIELVGLAMVVFLLWAVVVWFSRQFEIIFWVSLWPVAAALATADPRQKFFNYVKTQVVGLAFTQAAMAFALYLTIAIPKEFDTGPQSNPWFGLIMYGIMAAGFYFTAQVPKYWKELNGHSTSGGHEMAAMAGGYMAGRFGGQLLAKSKGGQMLAGVTDNWQSRHEKALHVQAARPSMHQRVQDTAAHWQGELAQAQAEPNAGFRGFAAQAASAGLSVATPVAATVARAVSPGRTARAHVRRLAATGHNRAVTRAWTARENHVSGVAQANLRAEGTEAAVRQEAMARAPEDHHLVMAERDPERTSAPTPRKKQSSAQFWQETQGKFAARAQGLSGTIDAAQTAIPLTLNSRQMHAASSLRRQRRLLQSGAQSPAQAQEVVRQHAGYTSVKEMYQDPQARTKILESIQSLTDPVHPRANEYPMTARQSLDRVRQRRGYGTTTRASDADGPVSLS